MKQLVQEPTREQYLLDLCLTDIAGTKAEVGSKIADHKFLNVRIPFPETCALQIIRKCFNLKRIRWPALKTALK